MNRRLIWFGLAAVAVVGLFVASKSVASWRPVKMADLPAAQSPFFPPIVRASSRAVVAGNNPYQIVDLQTGKSKPLGKAAPIEGGEGTLAFFDAFSGTTYKGMSLQLRAADGSKRAFLVRGISWQSVDSPPEVEAVSIRSLHVAPQNNRVELLYLDSIYFRWNWTTHKRERETRLECADFGREEDVSMPSLSRTTAAISRDGERVVSAGFGGISVNSTQTGKVTRKMPQPRAQWVRLSPYGAYAIYNGGPGFKPNVWRVIETKSGRVSWTFEAAPSADIPIFTTDEKQVALRLNASKIWQIRDLTTGQILRTLPLLPGTQTGAFAPDGATLYSIAGNVLYRQRAR